MNLLSSDGTFMGRSKWYEDKKNIVIGDVLLMMDPNELSNLLQKGFVANIYSTKDAQIRIVGVKIRYR